MWHGKGKGGVFAGFWLGGPKVRDQWGDLGVGGRITLSWTFGFHKESRIFLKAE
jgi:hypothetical protein